MSQTPRVHPVEVFLTLVTGLEFSSFVDVVLLADEVMDRQVEETELEHPGLWVELRQRILAQHPEFSDIKIPETFKGLQGRELREAAKSWLQNVVYFLVGEKLRYAKPTLPNGRRFRTSAALALMLGRELDEPAYVVDLAEYLLGFPLRDGEIEHYRFGDYALQELARSTLVALYPWLAAVDLPPSNLPFTGAMFAIGCGKWYADLVQKYGRSLEIPLGDGIRPPPGPRTTEWFSLDVILSVATDREFSVGPWPVHNLINHLLGYPVDQSEFVEWPYGLRNPLMRETVLATLELELPWLMELRVNPEHFRFRNSEFRQVMKPWVDELQKQFGSRFQLPLGPGIRVPEAEPEVAAEPPKAPEKTEAQAKVFSTDAVLSLATTVLVCEFGVMHELIEHVAGAPVFTHELGDKRTVTRLQEALRKALPWVAKVTPPPRRDKKKARGRPAGTARQRRLTLQRRMQAEQRPLAELWRWRDRMNSRFGTQHLVPAPGDELRDEGPLAVLERMAPGTPVTVVVI